MHCIFSTCTIALYYGYIIQSTGDVPRVPLLIPVKSHDYCNRMQLSIFGMGPGSLRIGNFIDILE